MINSMTPAERQDPDLLSRSPSRRRRIAKGAGYGESDVSKLVSDFQRMRSLMQQMGQGWGMPGIPGMGMPGMPWGGGTPGDWNQAPPQGWRGYPGAGGSKKKKKDKKKKGFGDL
jgi:signal recognition particle subunit SRP54